jgi:hypothetical protein
MSTTAAVLSGIAGAVSLNLMHECTRKTVPHAPRVDIVGMRAVAKIARAVGAEPPTELRKTALAGDLVANSIYYAGVAFGGKRNAVLIGAVGGLAAGIGALLLSPPMGVGDAEVNRTTPTQVMTAGLYLGAGLIAGAVYRSLADD